MSSDHGHVHNHGPAAKDHDDGLTYWRAMEIALRELLIEKGLFSADAVRRAVEAMDSRTPENGARLVARAWTDFDFKARLLADGSAAAQEMGFEVGTLKLMVIENTSSVHNLVVCTLCSCYPRMLIGLPPAWYKVPLTAEGRCASRGRRWGNLARLSLTMSKCAFTTARRICVT